MAPYWSPIDIRLAGKVNYTVFTVDNDHNDYLGNVSRFLQSEKDPEFQGNWMLAATWDRVHRHPHGHSEEYSHQDPYLQLVNQFFYKNYSVIV